MEITSINDKTITETKPYKTPEKNQGAVKVLTNPSNQIPETSRQGITPDRDLSSLSCTAVSRIDSPEQEKQTKLYHCLNTCLYIIVDNPGAQNYSISPNSLFEIMKLLAYHVFRDNPETIKYNFKSISEYLQSLNAKQDGSITAIFSSPSIPNKVIRRLEESDYLVFDGLDKQHIQKTQIVDTSCDAIENFYNSEEDFEKKIHDLLASSKKIPNAQISIFRNLLTEIKEQAENDVCLIMKFVNIYCLQSDWKIRCEKLKLKQKFYPSGKTSPVDVSFFKTDEPEKLGIFIGKDKNQVPDISHLGDDISIEKNDYWIKQINDDLRKKIVELIDNHDAKKVISIFDDNLEKQIKKLIYDDLQRKLEKSNVAVRLPLKNGNVVDLIMLNDNTTTNVVDTLKNIISSLNNDNIKISVNCSAPELKLEAKMNLTSFFNKILKPSIPSEALNEGFEALAHTDISAEQQLMLEMNETGFKGLACTSLNFYPECEYTSSKLNLCFNRGPLYIVVSQPDKSNQNIKFFTVVNNPSEIC